MTEAEWLESTEPTAMIAVISDAASPRRLRLFAAACCRQHWEELEDPRERQAIALAEELADGLVTEKRRSSAEAALCDLRDERQSEYGGDWELGGVIPLDLLAPKFAAADADGCADTMTQLSGPWGGGPWLEDELKHEQADLLRDIFGNPFRPARIDPRWRTVDAVGLARGIYEDRAFGRLPLLADALMDAGCADEQVLGHCRGPGPHVRGCWVVDLVLGKK